MKELYGQLSNREKKMLYILLCFLIVVAGWFLLITPALDKQSELNQKYQEALSENASKQTELSGYIAAPDQLKTKKESLEEIIKKYNPKLTNEKIDKLLTTAFLTNGLRPISLAISDVKAASVSNSTEKQGDTKKEAVSSEYVTQATANVSISGTLAQITNIIDTLNKMNGVEISSFTYTPSTGADNSQTSATLTIIVYMTSQ